MSVCSQPSDLIELYGLAEASPVRGEAVRLVTGSLQRLEAAELVLHVEASDVSLLPAFRSDRTLWTCGSESRTWRGCSPGNWFPSASGSGGVGSPRRGFGCQSAPSLPI